MPIRSHRLALAASLALVAAEPAAAQSTAAHTTAADSAARLERRTAVFVSPISIMIGAFAGEMERVVAPGTTLGLGLTYENRSSLFFSGDQPGDYDLDASVKLRYYPSAQPFDGLAVAALLGGTVYRRHPADDVLGDEGTFGDEDGNLALTFGFSFDYTRLMGRDRRLALGTGGGFKRRIVRDRNDFDALTSVRPTLRAVIGYAF